MSIFHKLFGKNSEDEARVNLWNELKDDADLDAAINKSFDKKVVIFKHSTRCGVSRMVLKKFENEMALKKDEVEFYFLDLLAHREISNKIADKLGVKHQSPQMIVVENGKAVKNASHDEITIRLL